MNINDIRIIFLLTTIGFAFLSSIPLLTMVLPEVEGETFSELWLLDAENQTSFYPITAKAGIVNSVFVGVRNHMGTTQSYVIKLKIRNETQGLPDINGSMASALPSFYEYQIFVADGEIKQLLVNFELLDISVSSDTLNIDNIVIDDISCPVNTSTEYDTKANGYFFQLFFELWRYDIELNEYIFDNRFVTLWINVDDML